MQDKKEIFYKILIMQRQLIDKVYSITLRNYYNKYSNTRKIDENKFLILIKPVLSSSDFPEVFAKTCSVAKKKFFIKGFEIQLAKKKKKILKTRMCK